MSHKPNFYYEPIKEANRLLDLERCAIRAWEGGLITQTRLAELLGESLHDLMTTAVIEEKKVVWEAMSKRRFIERLQGSEKT